MPTNDAQDDLLKSRLNCPVGHNGRVLDGGEEAASKIIIAVAMRLKVFQPAEAA
jgi:hypothetical protein